MLQHSSDPLEMTVHCYTRLAQISISIITIENYTDRISILMSRLSQYYRRITKKSGRTDYEASFVTPLVLLLCPFISNLNKHVSGFFSILFLFFYIPVMYNSFIAYY